MMIRLPVPAAAALLAAAAMAGLPAAAQAKTTKHPHKLDEATYTVKARATLDERWSYDELASDLCVDGCSRETKGSGSAHLDLTATPTHWLVMRGAGGRPPIIDVGDGEGAQLTGTDRRTGDLSTVYGGRWASANPPEIAPNSGCGPKDIKIDFTIAFTGKAQLSPVATPDLDREDCPDGPTSGLPWRADVPTLSEVTTTSSPTRFLSVRSFTVAGTRTWSTTAEPATGTLTRSGTKTVTWRWSVTFTMNR
jgi:hypothetical protein